MVVLAAVDAAVIATTAGRGDGDGDGDEDEDKDEDKDEGGNVAFAPGRNGCGR